MKELKDLQVGDKVILHNNGRLCIKQVEKVTKKYLLVDGDFFNKDNGNKRGAGLWKLSYIEAATDEYIKEWEETERREILSKKLIHHIGLGLPLETLERIMKIVEE